MFFHFTQRLSILVLLLVSLTACSNQPAQQTAAAKDGSLRHDDITAAIESRYRFIIGQVKRGELDRRFAEKANRLRLDLEKYIIMGNAEIETLQLDMLHGDADRKDSTRDRIREIAGQMEQERIECLRQMQLLVAESGAAFSDATEKGPPENVGTSRSRTKTDTRWEVRDLDIEIEVAPEDISRGDRE